MPPSRTLLIRAFQLSAAHLSNLEATAAFNLELVRFLTGERAH